MINNNIPADFITNWFSLNDDKYKIAYSPEFQVNRGELDFTGNFVGILISSKRGTQTFLEDKHPDKIFECAKFPLQNAPVDLPEQLILKSFDYKEDIYKVVIVPEFGAWEDGPGLDFSGCYEGLLVSCKTGTVTFQIEPTGDELEVIGEDIEPGLGDIISNLVKTARSERSMA